MGTRVLIADDHAIIRDGLTALLKAQQGMQVLGTASDGRTAVELTREMAPDVVIMDIAMPDLNGMEATRQIREASPPTRVIALSMHSDRRFVQGMLKSGADGYLLKDSAFEELVQAVRAVTAGQRYLSTQITDVVLDQYMDLAEDEGSPASVLSAREREVLQLLAEGKATKQIALLLDISVKTVETYRSRLMSKLDLRSVPELTKYAIREGLTFLDE